MSEADAVSRAAARGPATVGTLTWDLRALGVAEGMTVVVHSSLSKLGWVAGGAIAVVEALRRAVGDGGTLVMPTHTTHLTDPANWSNPPVPEAWWETIRHDTPPFDPAVTPSRFMGAVAEAFRTSPEVLRSNHPVGSFAAQGPHARRITQNHPLGDVFGDGSPLGRLYDLGASILLLGVGHDNNTSLHLAEARSRNNWRDQGSPIRHGDRAAWVTYRERLHDSDDFPRIAEQYAANGGEVRVGPVGAGEATLVPMQPLVDFACGWMVDPPAPTYREKLPDTPHTSPP